MKRSLILTSVAVCLAVTSPLAQEYNKEYKSTASDYPAPPIERKDFKALNFIELPGATAIFTEVMVEPAFIEDIKDDIRAKLPNAHVRRLVAGGDDTDQTLMIMWHPKEAFRPAINDYFRVLDPMRGVKGTRTYIGTSDRFPDNYPGDTLIGWKFVKFRQGADMSAFNSMSTKLRDDPDVLEVSRLAAGDYNMVVVYRFSGANVSAMQEVNDRLSTIVRGDEIEIVNNKYCP
ncbi:hypothetical protein U8P73_36105 (plasmid) [Rhizobium beringeri]|uniref:hypothetical protein n=1 Tax=Rhizobium beringeri TaxID=3019934 RepID=UPI002DDDB699|nr:hypothetical protein [Rhizobium beringeri]WSG93574.1 hypothetical protein U8P73_36105 [Rhizobium beringeri]